MTTRRDLLLAAGAMTMMKPLWAQGGAASVPSLIRYVVPFSPGGLTDSMARMMSARLAESLKTTVVVDNKAGGNGQIGPEAVVNGPADGSQLLAITLTHAANVTLFPKARYSLMKDLTPVALLAGSPMLVVVPANSPIKDFKALMSASKTRKLNAGTSGNGTPPHLTMALFNDLNKSEMVHVPYKGGAPSMADLMGGQLDVVFSNFPESSAHVKSGRLRPLAFCSAARNPQLPDVPTTADVGMSGLQVENWTAAMTRAGTPSNLVDRYSRELIKALYTAEVEARAKVLGFLPKPMGVEPFETFLKSEVARWARIIKAANIRVS